MDKTISIPWKHKEGQLVAPRTKTIWNKEFYRRTIVPDERIKELLSTSWLISKYPRNVTVDVTVLSMADPKTALTKIKAISYEGIEVVPDLFTRWDIVKPLLSKNNLYAGPVYTVGKDTLGVETFRLLNIYLAYKKDDDWYYV